MTALTVNSSTFVFCNKQHNLKNKANDWMTSKNPEVNMQITYGKIECLWLFHFWRKLIYSSEIPNFLTWFSWYSMTIPACQKFFQNVNCKVQSCTQITLVFLEDSEVFKFQSFSSFLSAWACARARDWLSWRRRFNLTFENAEARQLFWGILYNKLKKFDK